MGWFVYFLLASVLCVVLVNSRPTGDSKEAEEKTLIKLLQCLLDSRNCQKDPGHQSRGFPVHQSGKTRSSHVHGSQHLNKQAGTRKIYYNAWIYTVDKDGDPNWHLHPKEAMVVDGRSIVFVGTEKQAENYDSNYQATWVDLKGQVVLPGLHDVHQHPIEAMSEAGATCIFSENDDLEAIGNKIKSTGCAKSERVTEWVIGHGHGILKVLKHLDISGSRTPREILDEAIPDKPAVLMEQTSHSVLVNSRALSEAGITATSSPITGGVVWKDAQGEPNGLLLENAGNYVMSLAMAPSVELNKVNKEGLKKAIQEVNSYGITSLCDARTYWARDHDDIWWDLYNNNPELFTVRAVLALWAAPEITDDAAQIQEMMSRFHDDPDSRLRVSQIKVYSDGLLETTTAAMLEEYSKDYHLQGLEENKGINYFDQDRLTSYMSQLQSFKADGKGFDFIVHGIGDRGIREVLNSVEASSVGANEVRHRVTHVETLSPDDVTRFSALGVIADFQVAGDFTLPEFQDDLFGLIGQAKARSHIPVKSVLGTGAHVTLSSDWDVSPVNPFQGMYHALIRGDQSVDIKTALEMYTINAAYVMRQEDKVGSLVAGKEADFIVVDTDVLDPYNKHYILDTLVLRTVLQGETVYVY